jgi:hypothetical protein
MLSEHRLNIIVMLSQPISELQFFYIQHSSEMPKQKYKFAFTTGWEHDIGCGGRGH